MLKTADGSLTLHSARYDQTYHSHHGALTEARYVYLNGAEVGARLLRGDPTDVLEVGFGLGLNALLTLTQPGPGALRYTALEHDLLPTELLTALGYHDLLDDPNGVIPRWHDARRHLGDPPPATGAPSWALTPTRHLTLQLGDALDTAPHLPEATYHAVYHDAFSPDANAELWTPDFLGHLFRLTHPGGLLVTYCVKGVVRRALAEVGYEVHKRPGPPGGKREVLTARRPA